MLPDDCKKVVIDKDGILSWTSFTICEDSSFDMVLSYWS